MSRVSTEVILELSHNDPFMKLIFAPSALLCALFSLAHAEQIVFSEVMYNPPAAGYEFIEVENLTATPFDIALWEMSSGVDFTFPDFDAGSSDEAFLKAFERIIITETDEATFRAAYSVPASVRVFGPWTGGLSNGGERITLSNKNGVIKCTLMYNDRDVWPLAADGGGHSLYLTDTSYAIDDHRVWSSASPTPGSSGAVEAEEAFPNPEVNLATGIPFVNYADTWDFNDQNLNLGTTWKDPNYDYSDAGWTLEGAGGNNGGLYGFETSALPAPGLNTGLLNSATNDNHITYYFRKEFTYNGTTAGATVTVDGIIDDGVYFYLNGIPIGGAGVSAGSGWKDTASRTVSNATEELGMANNDGSGLVTGTNVIAAEVHQTNDSSSDCVFGARLSIAAPSAPGIVINEVVPSASGFVEFYNPTGSTVNLNGWYLSDEPGNLTKHQISGISPIVSSGLMSVGFTSSNLAVAATTVVYLTEPDGSTIANAISAAIPLDGRSLGRKPDGAGPWFLFTQPTQNASNASGSSEAQARINEVSYNAAGTAEWVELYNPSAASLNLNGLFLASEGDFSDKLALGGSIGGNGVLSVTTSFDASGDELTLFLVDGSNNVLGASAVPYSAPRFYSAAYPDGSGEFYASTTGTQNAANNPDRETAIVINEMMVDSPSNQRDGEYLELYNRGGSLVDLSGWQFSHGVDFTFPVGTTLAPGAYLVVAANSGFTASAHPGANIVGQYEGQLANGGELVRLVDSWGNLADEVHYSTGGQWPALAGGLGSSLELKHPDMDNSKASAWADSDESNKSTFESYSLTEQYQQLRTNGGASDYEELHIQAVGDAHLAFKNMSLTKGGGNILPNNGAVVVTGEFATTGWLCQGTHHQSTMVGNEFHLISSGHGDVKANRCEIDVTQIADNDILTLTFDARWVSGKPTVLFQTWDRSFGEVFHLPIPKNLGTAGAANSAAIGAARPVVSGLIHSPAVPTSSDPVRVTAEVSGATTVNLRHRLDNASGSGTYLNTTMFDDGVTGGDEVAGDGVYSATLSNYQSDNSIVQFYVEASSAGGTTISPRPAPESPAMWVVDNTTQPTDLRMQRFVISARDVSASGGSGDSATFNYKFPRLSNHYFNTTFIDDDKRIIYNTEMRKSGSPWTRSSGSDFSRMKWKPPGDRPFRGYAKRAVDNDAGGSRAYHNRIIRYWLYLFGHAANENEFVRVVINGGGASLREDVEPNSTDFLKRNWEDGEKGELYRIDDDWYIRDDWGRNNSNATWQNKGTGEPERYAGEWIKRSRENEYDYSSFVNWVESVGSNNFTRPEIERMADIDMMAANGVVRGWVDDWDTLTRNRGKNGYFLRRASDGKWMLIQWDSDNTFGNSGAAFFGNLAGVRNFFDKPYVRQRVNYYLGEMIDKYTAGSPRLTAWMLAEENASNSFSINEATYNNFNAARISRAQSEIGSSNLAETFDVTTGNGSSTSTSADTITLNGTSPVAAFTIHVVGQPDLEWEFQSRTTWTLSGIQLFQGANVLTVQAVDANGVVVGTENFTVNKSGNALPVAVLDADPSSFNLSVNDAFEMDATGSFDPEGTALTFAWGVSPAAALTNPSPSSVELTFSTPGLYDLTLTLTDGDSEQRVVTREIAVYPESGWSPFNDDVLSSNWTPENIEVRDGDSPSASYSLRDLPNNLLVKVERDAAHPLTMSSPTHPIIWRDLPASDDWSFHTDLVLDSVQQGDFYSGLIFELVENGATVRYAIGMEDGDFLRVKRATGGGYTQLTSINWDQGSAVVRGKRIGNQLIFEYRSEPGVWVNLLTRALSSPATGVKGGLFAATDSLQEVRLAFDYALIVDPSVISPTLEYLKITELMYHPIEGSALEFIEVRNTSANPLSIENVSIADGSPVGALSIGAVTLAPGAYGLIVANSSEFQNIYGNGSNIVGEWASGALSNGGEEIILRDPSGNVIHQFEYDDDAPWAVAADGNGPSLEIIDENGDHSDPANWRASSVLGGSPGSAAAVDSDGDGLSNLRESAAGTNIFNPDSDSDGVSDGNEVLSGTDSTDPDSCFQLTSVEEAGPSEVIRVIWSTVAGKDYELQHSDGLHGWVPLMTVTATGSITSFEHPTGASRSFYRVKVLP